MKCLLRTKFLDLTSSQTEALIYNKGDTTLPSDVFGCHFPVLSLNTLGILYHPSNMPKRSTVWYKHAFNLKDAEATIENARVRSYDILLLFISTEAWDILSTTSMKNSESIQSKIILLSDSSLTALSTRSRPLSILLTPIHQKSHLQLHFQKMGNKLSRNWFNSDEKESKESLEYSKQLLKARGMEKSIVPSNTTNLLETPPVEYVTNTRITPRTSTFSRDVVASKQGRKRPPIKRIPSVGATKSPSYKKCNVEMNFGYDTIENVDCIPMFSQNTTSKASSGDVFLYSSGAVDDKSVWSTNMNKQHNITAKQDQTTMLHQRQDQTNDEIFQIPSAIGYSTKLVRIVEEDTRTKVVNDSVAKRGTELRNESYDNIQMLKCDHLDSSSEFKTLEILRSRLKMTEYLKKAKQVFIDTKGPSTMTMYTVSRTFQIVVGLVFVFGLVFTARHISNVMVSTLSAVSSNQNELAALHESLEVLMVISRNVEEENKSNRCDCPNIEYKIEKESETIISECHTNDKDRLVESSNHSSPTFHINAYRMVTDFMFGAAAFLLSRRYISKIKFHNFHSLLVCISSSFSWTNLKCKHFNLKKHMEKSAFVRLAKLKRILQATVLDVVADNGEDADAGDVH